MDLKISGGAELKQPLLLDVLSSLKLNAVLAASINTSYSCINLKDRNLGHLLR
jgi:hypothetical protein